MIDIIAVKKIVIPADLVMSALIQKEVLASNLYLEHTRLEYRSEYTLKFINVLIRK